MLKFPKITNDVCFVAVTYNEYGNYDWAKICTSSFRQFFPKENLVFVDHNNNPQEKSFLETKNVTVISGAPERKHGLGLDCATKYCRDNNYNKMIVLEPDCIIYGKEWAHELIRAIYQGNKMASTFRYPYGLLHPCVSIWDVPSIPYSFEVQSNHEEILERYQFQKIVNYENLFRSMINSNYGNDLLWFFTHQWDTGMRNSYFFQRRNKAAKINGKGIIHIWASHKHGPTQAIKRIKHFHEYLQPWIDKLDQL